MSGIVRDSFVVGLQAGFRFVSVVALAGFLVALLFVGGRLHWRRRDGPAGDG